MNPLGVGVIALGVVLVIVGWRGSLASTWQMLTGRTLAPHKAGTLTSPIDYTLTQPVTGSSATAPGGVSLNPGGNHLALNDFYNALVNAGMPAARAAIGAAVAMAESAGNLNAVGDNGTSYGPWQIHLPAHPDVTAACATNLSCAAAKTVQISSNGTNWNPWTTYTNGAYRRYYDTTVGHGALP